MAANETVTSAKRLAAYIVNKCVADGYPVSNLQLQKMMYFLQTVYCRATGGQLLFPDEFEAWPYGPVLREIYEEYSDYGGNVIIPATPAYKQLEVPSTVGKFIDDGVESLRAKYPWDLVRISHAKGSPWDQVYQGGSGYKQIIPNDLLINVVRSANN